MAKSISDTGHSNKESNKTAIFGDCWANVHKSGQGHNISTAQWGISATVLRFFRNQHHKCGKTAALFYLVGHFGVNR
jgi:hypothetical protein